MSLSILGGKFQRHRILTPKGSPTRPTSSLVRKALFDICRPWIEGAHFLDLFAGSGAMGLEALSQGAASAIFIDSHPAAVRCIRENLERLGIASQGEVFCSDARSALEKLSARHVLLDLIYVDPPYHEGRGPHELLGDTLRLLDSLPLLQPGGRLFVECSSRSGFDPQALSCDHLALIKTRTFGSTRLYELKSEPSRK